MDFFCRFFQAEAVCDGVVEQWAERSYFDVVGRGVDPVAEENDSKLFFRVNPDAGAGVTEMSVRCFGIIVTC